jgi:hypothetical protein
MKQRKIILSRKGFDSKYGGRPSPILPDGTMLSLPIPDDDECTRYDDLFFEGVSYLNIIRDLGYSKKVVNCHLDPDLRYDVAIRNSAWRACFGQSGAAASHLKSNSIGVGDIFLFFGWFRKPEYDINRKLRYLKGAPDIHAIYGYLQVGEIEPSIEETAKFKFGLC